MPSNSLPPKPAQLSYLRGLARKTGTTFIYPQTRAHASREIDRLKAIADTGFTFAELRTEQAVRELHGDEAQLSYAAAIRDDEIYGYGSSATWSRRP